MKVYDKFNNFIEKKELVFAGDKILLGVSGGPDSLTMLDLFFKLSSEKNIEIAVFHLNHLFRKEAAKEAQFVKKMCNDYGIDCYLEEFNIPDFAKENSLSSEQAARKIRMDFLFSYIEKLNFDKVALAHNKNDLIETVFLNMFRGCSLSGLGGIEAKSLVKDNLIIHPLLSISRNEIESYCQQEDLNPCYDQSNEETIYTRNKIRHKIIPYIEKEINPSLKDVMIRMTNLIKEEDDYLDKLAQNFYSEIVLKEGNEEIIIDYCQFKNLDEVMKRRIFFNTIYKLKEIKADIYLKHYKEIKKILNKKNNKKIDLPGSIKVKKEYNKLIIKKGNFEEDIKKYSIKLNLNSKIKLPYNYQIKAKKSKKNEGWKKEVIKNNRCLVDFNKINFPLKVRNRRAGDKFAPLGLNGSKKIKDYFIDKKVKKSERDKIPLVVDNNGLIIWIAGYHINEKAKITKETDNILKLFLIEGEDNNE